MIPFIIFNNLNLFRYKNCNIGFIAKMLNFESATEFIESQPSENLSRLSQFFNLKFSMTTLDLCKKYFGTRNIYEFMNIKEDALEIDGECLMFFIYGRCLNEF